MTGVLHGHRVLIPRPAGRVSRLAALLAAEGAEPQAVPMISIAPPEDLRPLDDAVRRLSSGAFDWVGFTSVNAVTAVADSAVRQRLDPVVAPTTRVAAVGPSTAGALRRRSIAVDLTPTVGGSAAALGRAWPADPPGTQVLLPRSVIASAELVEALTGSGHRVSTVTAYVTTVLPVPTWVAADLAAGRFAAVLLTSPSTVAALTGTAIATGTAVGVLGKATAQAAVQAGLRVAFTAAAPTDAALVRGLVAWRGVRP